MNGFIALGRLKYDDPTYRELVRGNVLLHLVFQANFSEGFVYSRPYEEIAWCTGLHVSSVKRRLSKYEKDGLITRRTWTDSKTNRTHSEVCLELTHPLFKYLQNTELDTDLGTELDAELDADLGKPFQNKGLDGGAELDAELDADLGTELDTDLYINKSKREQYKEHLLFINSGVDDPKIEKAIGLAQHFADQWNLTVGTSKQLSKANCVHFYRHLQKDRSVEILERLNVFLPHSYLDYKVNGNTYAFRTDNPQRWLDEKKFVDRIRTMEQWEKLDKSNKSCTKKMDLPKHLKKMNDPFYEPTQAELLEYQKLLRS